ncbi:hypothetical protein [Janthinobacterium sp. RB2R34]|uniref:hypothetical protein n=1 Tax=Janthinobacterium sp. RB2R34 TaxID=3424193 RepID=UPI003F263C9A
MLFSLLSVLAVVVEIISGSAGYAFSSSKEIDAANDGKFHTGAVFSARQADASVKKNGGFAADQGMRRTSTFWNMLGKWPSRATIPASRQCGPAPFATAFAIVAKAHRLLTDLLFRDHDAS